MLEFIIKRVLLLIPLLIGVSLVCFILVNLNPSDPAEVALRVNSSVSVTPEAIEATRIELGLNKPLYMQYFLWVQNIFQGDLGFSYETRKPVLDELITAMPTTFYLSIAALVLTIVLGLILGVLCAIYENSRFDKLIRTIVFTTSSMPSFWLSLLLIWAFSIHFNIFPSNGLENFSGIVLPAFALAVTHMSTFVRILRNSLIQIKNSLFVTYAKARGLSKYQILMHQIKNVINPFIVAINMSIPRLFAGTVVIENIFALPGFGRLSVHAIFARDFPIIQSYVLFVAVLFIVFNLFADIFLHLRDSRLRR